MPDPKLIRTGGIVPETDLRLRLFHDNVLSKAAIARLSEGLPPRPASGTGGPVVIQTRRAEIKSWMRLQDPEPKEPQPHPDDGLPDPGNGRPCPPDTRGGCPDEPPRPVPDPSPPRPGSEPVPV